MPVRHRELGDELAPPQPKRCRHCDEKRSSCGSGGGDSEGSEGRESWRVTLDHDLVETLSAIYPEWFKPQRRERSSPAPASPVSPPSAPRTPISDDALSWGAESDIMAGRAGSSGGSGTSESASSPPRVSPPKVVVDDSPLQPAMGKHKESLKVKLMMRRPINQLVAQGIMPPLKTPPAYFEQCKQLERAKTGDLLKAKIQKRPDRQELERRHILEQESHVDPSLAEKQRMLKKARLADQLNDQLSHRPGPLELIKKNILHTEETIETAVKSGTVAFRATCEGASARPPHPSSYCGPPEELSSPSPSPPAPAPAPAPAPTVALAPAPAPAPAAHGPQHPAPGKDKNRKKNKQKHHQQPKARFKFHEYKGPPSAHKAAAVAAASPSGDEETPYELLLQQQQMLLQLMLPASPAASISSVVSDSSDALPPLGAPPPPPPPPPPPALAAGGAPVSRFEDMKVSDLRAECKRRNLRVSGPKPQLLDRLRPYLGEARERDEAPPPRSPLSVASVLSAASAASPEPEASEDIVQSQRRQIEELERKLEASRQQLEAVRRDAAGAAASDQSRRLLQAHLCVSQLRAQLDALQQPAPAAAPPPPPSAAPPAPPALPAHAAHTAHAARIVLTDTTPERLVRLFAVSPPGADQEVGGLKQNPAYILNGVKVVPIAILPTHYEAPAPAPPPPPPPPPPPMPQLTLHDSEDSQIMDDVLEILVENGELPASAVDSCCSSRTLDSGYLTAADERPRDAADELQRELNDLQNELLSHHDLGVDLLASNFHAEFDGSGAADDQDNFFGSLLAGPGPGAGEGGGRGAAEEDAMDVGEEPPERMSVTPLPGADLLEPGRPCFEDMDDLSLPSLSSEEPRHGDFDLKEFGIELSHEMSMDNDNYEYMEPQLIPNLFGRGHVPPCDPLLGGVLGGVLAPAPRPQRKHYSWDRLEFDAT